MDTQLNGLFSERDTRELRKWVEREFLSTPGMRAAMPDVKTDIALLRQTVEKMERKIEYLERRIGKAPD